MRNVVLRSERELFTTGNDLGNFSAQSKAEETPAHCLIRALANSTIPIVAAVQCKAVGIGTKMLLHCEYAVMADDAQLTTPFVDLALVPEAASSVLLPRRIGHARDVCT